MKRLVMEDCKCLSISPRALLWLELRVEERTGSNNQVLHRTKLTTKFASTSKHFSYASWLASSRIIPDLHLSNLLS